MSVVPPACPVPTGTCSSPLPDDVLSARSLLQPQAISTQCSHAFMLTEQLHLHCYVITIQRSTCIHNITVTKQLKTEI